MPLLDSSSLSLISSSTGSVRPLAAAADSSRSARRRESTESTASKSVAAFAALFDCRCPIRCACSGCVARSAVHSGCLVSNSCTLFSPTWVTPSSATAAMAAAGCILVTAISVIVSTGPVRAVAGGRDCLFDLRQVALQFFVSIHASDASWSPKRTQSSASAVKSSIWLRWLVMATRNAYRPPSTVLETI